MATGTGKTAVAFQICWNSGVCAGIGRDKRRPQDSLLADRNILIDDRRTRCL